MESFSESNRNVDNNKTGGEFTPKKCHQSGITAPDDTNCSFENNTSCFCNRIYSASIFKHIYKQSSLYKYCIKQKESLNTSRFVYKIWNKWTTWLHCVRIKYSKYHYNVKQKTALINIINIQNGDRKVQINLIQNYPYSL